MPTIELIGFGPKEEVNASNDFAEKFWKAISQDTTGLKEDVVIVEYPGSICKNLTGVSKPFIRVWSMSKSKFEHVHEAIQQVGKFDVEYAQMNNFFEKQR